MNGSPDYKPYLDELDRAYSDALYSAQTYFEAAKSSRLWAKAIVFVPSVVATIVAFAISIGQPKWLGAVGAIASVVAATASFMGSIKTANTYENAAKRFTNTQHKIRLERSAMVNVKSIESLDRRVRELQDEYADIVLDAPAVSNRFFRRAQKRIGKGDLSYEGGGKVAGERQERQLGDEGDG